MTNEPDKPNRWRPWQLCVRTMFTLMLAGACCWGGWMANDWHGERRLNDINFKLDSTVSLKSRGSFNDVLGAISESTGLTFHINKSQNPGDVAVGANCELRALLQSLLEASGSRYRITPFGLVVEDLDPGQEASGSSGLYSGPLGLNREGF